MAVNLFLVRAAASSWCEQRRIVGRADVALSPRGHEQAQRAVAALAELAVDEIVSSPMARALQTAECFAERFGVEVTRDPRLADIAMSRWEGRPRSELHADEAYQRFIDGCGESLPADETLEQIRARALASVRQALADNAGDGNIVIVSHSAPLRILLAEFLCMPIADFPRLQLGHASLSVVRCSEFPERARVLSINWNSDALRELISGDC